MINKMSVLEKIDGIVKNNRIALFMKGTPEVPMCGFSAVVSKILSISGHDYYSVDVLADEEIRQGIKTYGNWPTIPQLYVDGELIGGADIVKEMYQSGELADVLQGKVNSNV